MKIMIIARGYPTDKFKMNGIFEFDQAKALVEAGIDVVYAVIDVRSIRRWRKWGYECLVKDGVKIESINIPCGKLPNKFLNKIKEFLLNRLYKKIVHKYGKPDIIHSHFIGMGYIAAKLLKKTNIPLVHTEHFSKMNQKELDKYYHYLGSNTYIHMDKVIAVSKSLGINLIDNFKIKPIVIPNIVDTFNFKYKPFDNLSDVFSFISVGSLLKNKRMDLLINSFHYAFKDNSRVKLFIFGEGPERKKLELLIKKLDLTNRVFLMGLKDRMVIAKKMQESDCFVLASKSETFGVAYIEAMATGLPVIATRCGGPENFINESNGILIQVDNKKELAQALTDMYLNVKSYNKELISKETIEKFSSNNIAKSTIEVYNKILEK